jgi:hypothetical protein
MLNLSDKANILDLSKGSMSLEEVGWHYGKMNQVSAVQYCTLHTLSIHCFSYLEPYTCRHQGFTVIHRQITVLLGMEEVAEHMSSPHLALTFPTHDMNLPAGRPLFFHRELFGKLRQLSFTSPKS